MFVESPVGVGRIIVLHELDFRRVGVVRLHEPVHKAGVIGLVFGARDLQMALTRVEVISQQHVVDAFSHVFLVFFLGGSRLGRNRGEYMVEQLAGPLVEAEPHHARCGGLRVHVQYVFHISQVLARDDADAPHLLQSGLAFAFFKTCRMDSLEIVSIYTHCEVNCE